MPAVQRNGNVINPDSKFAARNPNLKTVQDVEQANLDYSNKFRMWDKLGKAAILGTATLGFAPGVGVLGGGAAGGAEAAAMAAGTSGAATAGTGAAAAAGGSGMWGTILKAALPLIMGQIAGRQSKNAANQASGGARLQDLMPLIMPLLMQNQQHSQTNYQQQQDQYAKVQPLQDQIRNMAMRTMPRY